MGKILSVHSSRGGTGKSMIAVNLAAIYAREGKTVALFDMDFRAPSLSTVFKMGDHRLIEYWVNDFVNGRCSIDKILLDMTEKYDVKGKLMVGLANPSIDAIREIMAKDRTREMEALRRLLALKPTLLSDLRVDYAIYDTSPGIQYSALNAVVSSDIAVVVTTLDMVDIEGTQYMIQELYDSFEKDAVILLNKVPEDLISTREKAEKLSNQIKATFTQPPVQMIPCYCDVLRSSRVSIFALEKPGHPFSKVLCKVAEKLEQL